MEICQFDFSYMYYYSERPGTLAAKKMTDDVPEEVKKRRLAEIIDLQRQISLNKNAKYIGKVCQVLVEGVSKKRENELKGRNDQNIMVVFPKKHYQLGDYVNVMIKEATTNTLIGEAID